MRSLRLLSVLFVVFQVGVLRRSLPRLGDHAGIASARLALQVSRRGMTPDERITELAAVVDPQYALLARVASDTLIQVHERARAACRRPGNMSGRMISCA
jgi:hypothetical protein